MNEKIDLTKILKNCPKGTKFYSSVHGDLYYEGMDVSSSASRIYFTDHSSRSIATGEYLLIEYRRDGRIHHLKGECTLFPSKDQRDWSKFTAHWLKKERFDPKTLHPFDKVLVRDNPNYKWVCDLFSFIVDDYVEYKYRCVGSCNKYCIPYNDDTKPILGTAYLPPKYYIYWED